jgi:PEGA domain
MNETGYNIMKKSNRRSVFLFLLLSLLFITSFSQAEVLTGKVTSTHGDVIELDLGSERGIKSGDSGKVYYTIRVGGQEKPIFIAKFKITHLSEKSSMAQIEDSTGEVKAGYSVEVVVKDRVWLEVKSDPSGAKVYIDGKESGDTPLALSDIKTGRHQIRVLKEGYESYEVSVETGVGRKEIFANLKKKVKEGGLAVRTEPSGATIYLDGHPVGKSPYETKDLPPREYRIRISKEGYEILEKTEIVEGGKKAEVVAKLKEEDWNQKRCEAPVWKVGDEWTYKIPTGEIFTYEVVKIEEDLYAAKIEGQRHLIGYDKKTMNNTFVLETSGKRIENKAPFRKLYDFPIVVGKKWSDTTTSMPSASKTEATFSSEFQIEGVEEITTPAGTFKTFKIFYKQTVISPQRGSGWVRIWYSPVIKNWVRREVEKSPFWRRATWLQDAELFSYELK